MHRVRPVGRSCGESEREGGGIRAPKPTAVQRDAAHARRVMVEGGVPIA